MSGRRVNKRKEAVKGRERGSRGGVRGDSKRGKQRERKGRGAVGD